jgi:hypothetical protein
MLEAFERHGVKVEISRAKGEWMGYLLRPV